MKNHLLKLTIGAALLAAAATAQAEDDAPKLAVPGLPEGTTVDLEFSAGWGFFGFGNSLYANSHDEVTQDLSSNWMEGYVKGGFSLTHKLASGGEFYGKLTGVGERTYNAPPPVVGGEASSFDVEDLHVGWRNEQFDVMVGRGQYQQGHGMLIYDGASEGGSRGGFWSGARKAWEYAVVGRVSNDRHAIEMFYLDRDELPEADTDTTLAGANYELTLGEHTTLGVSYLKVDSDEVTRDNMDVYNFRAFTAPLRKVPGLEFELEYAQEENGDALATVGWSVQTAYTLVNVGWKPKLSYRYAFFEGDDPATARSEGFDMLFPGFHDWGTWWQGEIAGEYFLANSNLISHQLRLHFEPSSSIGAGLIGYVFQLDQPASFAAGATSDDLAAEIDGYIDWSINDNFTASLVLAYAEPDDAIEQGLGRTESLSYGMVYLSYSY